MCVCVYVCIYIYLSIYKYTHIYIYTHVLPHLREDSVENRLWRAGEL